MHLSSSFCLNIVAADIVFLSSSDIEVFDKGWISLKRCTGIHLPHERWHAWGTERNSSSISIV